MAHDVVADSQIPPERVRAEISKLLVETPPLEVSKNPVDYFAEVLAYLKEDYRVTRRSEREIKQIFIEEVANKLAKDPSLTKPWALGVHPMFLGQLRRELAKTTTKQSTPNKSTTPS
jgi:tRNA nucleotidyltransferase/poly(A) polymerase